VGWLGWVEEYALRAAVGSSSGWLTQLWHIHAAWAAQHSRKRFEECYVTVDALEQRLWYAFVMGG
jgi:hypothetical protein